MQEEHAHKGNGTTDNNALDGHVVIEPNTEDLEKLADDIGSLTEAVKALAVAKAEFEEFQSGIEAEKRAEYLASLTPERRAVELLTESVGPEKAQAIVEAISAVGGAERKGERKALLKKAAIAAAAGISYVGLIAWLAEAARPKTMKAKAFHAVVRFLSS